MKICICTSLLHIVWCYLLVSVLHWGLIGIGMAATLTSILNCFLVNLSCYYSKDLEASFFWPTWSELVTDLPAYFKTGVPSALMLILDWGTFDVLAIMSGLIGVVENGAQLLITTLLY